MFVSNRLVCTQKGTTIRILSFLIFSRKDLNFFFFLQNLVKIFLFCKERHWFMVWERVSEGSIRILCGQTGERFSQDSNGKM